MRVRVHQLLALVLVAGMLVPVAGAYGIPQMHGPAVTTNGGITPSDARTGASTPSGTNESNYTRLYVEEEYRHLELKPGGSSSFNVTVENGEGEPVALSPHVVVPKVRERPVKRNWVSIETANTTLGPNEERSFTVRVAVPDDAELGDYRGWIAFTEETISYPGRPPRPVHAASFNIEVWREPTVDIVSERHIHSRIEAGSTYTREIVVRNTGDQPVPVSPELKTEERRHPRERERTLQRSWFEIDAPNAIQPGENATVTVAISPPADASRGRYEAELDLGLKDPARSERDSYWQQIHLAVAVWQQPEEPFETRFDVSEDTREVTLELSARSSHHTGRDDAAEAGNFDVEFVAPNGTVIDAGRTRVTNSGHVDLGGDARATRNGAYAVEGGEKTFHYRLAKPQSGTWSVRIMPEDTVRFEYEIVRDEAG